MLACILKAISNVPEQQYLSHVPEFERSCSVSLKGCWSGMTEAAWFWLYVLQIRLARGAIFCLPHRNLYNILKRSSPFLRKLSGLAAQVRFGLFFVGHICKVILKRNIHSRGPSQHLPKLQPYPWPSQFSIKSYPTDKILCISTTG